MSSTPNGTKRSSLQTLPKAGQLIRHRPQGLLAWAPEQEAGVNDH